MTRLRYFRWLGILTCASFLAGCNPERTDSNNTAQTDTNTTQQAAEAADTATGEQNQSQQKDVQTRQVMQEADKIVYWVLPGPRELDPAVFGTAENPKMLAEPVIKKAEQMVKEGKMPPSVPDLLGKLPILAGVPAKARTQEEEGRLWLKQPNPFSDKASIVSGSFNATFTDMVKEDPPGKPGETPDKATLEAEFTDPDGNQYRVVLDHVVKPPFPGYQTQGGVMLDSRHHGSTGTGSPLMPEVDTKAALWGIGEVYVNGELVYDHRVMHFMTTEVVRNKEYGLVFGTDLPLSPDERHIRDQETHSHLVVLPIQGTPEGPVFSPLKIPFQLPNGESQPFMHIMYEQDEVID